MPRGRARSCRRPSGCRSAASSSRACRMRWTDCGWRRPAAEPPGPSRRVRGARIVRNLVGRIPILGRRPSSYAPGLLVAGDAAGHVKATSGGGIYFSLVAGRLAAEAAGAILGGDAAALPRYEQAWRRRFGRELVFTTALRRTLNRLPDPAPP